MPRYRIITLVDITRTQPKRSDIDSFRHKQQNNFDSFRQSIELRSNVYWVEDPVKHSGRFPIDLEGKGNYWTWEFEVEKEDLFLRDKDPVALLNDDLHGVPIIADLENTVEIKPAAIQTSGINANTWTVLI
jgi:hypothetical protein